MQGWGHTAPSYEKRGGPAENDDSSDEHPQPERSGLGELEQFLAEESEQRSAAVPRSEPETRPLAEVQV